MDSENRDGADHSLIEERLHDAEDTASERQERSECHIIGVFGEMDLRLLPLELKTRLARVIGSLDHSLFSPDPLSLADEERDSPDESRKDSDIYKNDYSVASGYQSGREKKPHVAHSDALLAEERDGDDSYEPDNAAAHDGSDYLVEQRHIPLGISREPYGTLCKVRYC